MKRTDIALSEVREFPIHLAYQLGEEEIGLDQGALQSLLNSFITTEQQVAYYPSIEYYRNRTESTNGYITTSIVDVAAAKPISYDLANGTMSFLMTEALDKQIGEKPTTAYIRGRGELTTVDNCRYMVLQSIISIDLITDSEEEKLL